MLISKNVGFVVAGLVVVAIIGATTGLDLRADQPVVKAAASSSVEVPTSAANPTTATSATRTSSQANDQEIQTLIKKLDANEFQDREQATQKLLSVGVGCVQPLVAATESSSREAAHRSLSLLEQFLNQKSDAALSAASEKALDQIATTRKNWVSQRASQALLQYNLTNQAGFMQKLVSLGAEIEYDEEASYPGIYVTIEAKNWQGKPADLQLIKKLPNLAHLKLFGPIFGDDEVPMLRSLTSVDFIDLYGTKVSDSAFQSLRLALPQVGIDRRKGGMLGIQGDPSFVEGCLVKSVQEKSAASEAGLEAGDIIKKIDGKELTGFTDLTAIISEKSGGEKVKLEIQRGEQKITNEVSLSAWRPDQTPNTVKNGFRQFQGNIIIQPGGGRIILGR